MVRWENIGGMVRFYCIPFFLFFNSINKVVCYIIVGSKSFDIAKNRM